MEELLARIRAVLRRGNAAGARSETASFVSGELEVNFAERRVTLTGIEVALTPTEYRVLQELVLNVGKVLTHRTLLQRVWGPEYGEESEYVRVFVNRLRRKLGEEQADPKYIKNERGVGYRFLTPS
jgi:two-component system KDP operon response regulator KdpE